MTVPKKRENALNLRRSFSAVLADLEWRYPHESRSYRWVLARLDIILAAGGDPGRLFEASELEAPFSGLTGRARLGVRRALLLLLEHLPDAHGDERLRLENAYSGLKHATPPRPVLVREDDPHALRIFAVAVGRRKTVEHVRLGLRLIEGRFGPLGPGYVPTFEHLEWLRGELCRRHPHVETAAVYFDSMLRFARWLRDVGLPAPAVLPRRVRTPKRPSARSKRTLSPSEWRRALLACEKTPDPPLFYLLVLLIQSTAMRIEDVLALTPRSIDARGEVVVFRQRKTGRALALPLTEPATAALRRYLDTRPSLPPDEPLLRYRGRPLRYETARRLYRRALSAVGLHLPKGVLFHVLRHSAATELFDLTGDVGLVADVLGISARNAETYIHAADPADRLRRLFGREDLRPVGT